MRAFIASTAGSGTNADPMTPDPPVGSPWKGVVAPSRGHAWKYLVYARDLTAAPADTYDLGDFTVPADVNRTLTNPEANALRLSTGDPTGTFNGMTIREVIVVLLEGIDPWTDPDRQGDMWPGVAVPRELVRIADYAVRPPVHYGGGLV